MEKIKKQRQHAILTLKLGILLGVAVAFCLPAIVLATAPFEDNFEIYAIGSLADQGGWVRYGGDHWQVNFDYAKTGYKSISCIGANHCAVYRAGDLVSAGTWQFSHRLANIEGSCNGATNFWFNQSLGVRQVGSIIIYKPGDVCEAFYEIYPYEEISLGATGLLWNTYQIEWDNLTQKVRYKMNLNDWTNWVEPSYDRATGGDFTGISFFTLYSGTWIKDYFDDILLGELPELRVWGVSPASGSTATSTEENFTIGWEGWDFEDIYKDFVFSFFQKDTGILVGTKIFEPATESGQKTYQFSDFGIDKNGKYNLHAKARSYWAIEYPVFYTGDLVSPAWWVNIEVEGWTPIFVMPVFEDWYAEHSKFATATAIFSGVSGLLSPVYNKIGEFGDRVVAFLNLDEAYDRGYNLGIIIPKFRQYISTIEVFFGGFPIIQIFLVFLVILLGIFIVRLILKFIPFLG